MNIGILGSGSIAHVMAKTVSQMDNAVLYAVASRDIEKAKKFAEKTGAEKYYGSYEELASDSSIDLIYIATPHSRHFEDCMLCLEHGRNVLCEKAFTANADQARKVIYTAQSNGLLVTEAIWTRYMPMRKVLDEIIASNVIGNISALTANLGYSMAHIERLKKPELAGGALLDVGVYTINFALMAFGNDIADIKSQCIKNEYGVDANNSIIINFKDGKVAMLHSNMCAQTDRLAVIYGDKGRIEFKNINNCEGITVVMNDGSIKEYKTPPQITGYEYEVISAIKAISEHKTECPEMPHSETLRVMDIMDSLRKEWGLIYPFE